MTDEATTISGIVIPSTDPAFLAVTIGMHIPLGIAGVVAGAGAMLSEKRRGRHSKFGTVYFWSLLALFASATFLSIIRRVDVAVVHDDTRGTLFPVYEVNCGIGVSSVDDGAGWNQT